MRYLRRRVWFVAGLLGPMLAGPVPAHAQTLQTLGKHPLCEASAAVLAPCHGGDGDCLLVGDNEVRDRLFQFRLDGAVIVNATQRTLAIEHLSQVADPQGGTISDIEGLARYPDGRTLVLGSHSRNSQCRQRPERRRLLAAVPGEPRERAQGTSVQSPPHGCAALFVERVRKDPLVREVCAVIERAEAAADAAARLGKKKKRRRACDAALPLNAEGVMIVSRGGSTETWVGLRAPLVEGQAVLLRQARESVGFRFDAVALADLDGRGVRELSVVGDTVFGIAGPPADATDPFLLWRVPLTALRPGGRMSTERVRELPSSAEGLAIIGSEALVLVDGESGKKRASRCKVPARYITVPLNR